MFKFISDKINEWSEKGIKLPYAFDSTRQEASVTLLFAYLSFMLTYTAIIFLLVKDLLLGTTLSICFWALSMVFYRMRNLSKVKLDLDDKQIDFEGNNDKEVK